MDRRGGFSGLFKELGIICTQLKKALIFAEFNKIHFKRKTFFGKRRGKTIYSKYENSPYYQITF